MNSRPIGIFDSGVGGLTVVKEIVKSLPNEKLIYLGDTARVPYGIRSRETVRKFANDDVNFLLRKKVKCIVIACNTVASQVGEEIRKKVNIPVLDVLNSGVNAVLDLKANSVGVIATNGTVKSKAYKVALEKKGKKVIQKACPLFVPFIEEGELKGRLINLLVEKYLTSIKAKKVDVLILGCTHYPLIKKNIKRFLGSGVKVLDSPSSVTQDLKKLLTEKDLLNSNKKTKHEFYLTDVDGHFVKIAKNFLGIDITKKIKLVELS